MVGLVNSYRGLNRCVLFANRVVIGWRKYKNNRLPIPYSIRRKHENKYTDYFCRIDRKLIRYKDNKSILVTKG